MAITYPKGETKVLAANGSEKVNVYEGQVKLTARIKLPDDAKRGELTINLRLRSQACDDRACLAPKTEELGVKVEVK